VLAVAAVDRTSVWLDDVYYLEVLKRLSEKVKQKRPELFANNSWILHHDQAPDFDDMSSFIL
jgi:hypothetical protein